MVKHSINRVRRPRTTRRGMTVFVVLLVIMMLGAVGIFAARASQLGVTNAGRHRQMMQTHYIAEGGMQASIAEFGRDPNSYLERLRASPAVPTVNTATGQFPCQDIPFQASTTFVPCSTVCLRLGYQAVEKSATKKKGSTMKVFNPKGADASTAVSLPGSFGMGNVAGNFTVEFTDERPIEPPPAGMAISGGVGASLKFRAVTARAMGQIIPTDDDGNPDPPTTDTYKYTTSVETIRAEVVVGPVP